MPYINIGKVTEELNELEADKVSKGHEVIEFQAPTAANSYTWYRKYADGWVEQGGLASQTSSSAGVGSSVILPVPMIDNNYFITFCNRNETTGNGASAYVQDMSVCQINTTGFTFSRNYNGPKRWEVKGMYAQ